MNDDQWSNNSAALHMEAWFMGAKLPWFGGGLYVVNPSLPPVDGVLVVEEESA